VSRIGQRLRAKLLLACIVAFSLATPAVARAQQIYSGSNCVFASKGTDWTLNRGALFNRNGLFSNRARVDCPIVKEQPGAAIRSASILVLDGSFPPGFTCELVAVEVVASRATVQRKGSARGTTGVDRQPERLDLPLFNQSSFGNVWFIGCFVPSGGSILSYTVDFR
jgi:hypothetical protein